MIDLVMHCFLKDLATMKGVQSATVNRCSTNASEEIVAWVDFQIQLHPNIVEEEVSGTYVGQDAEAHAKDWVRQRGYDDCSEEWF